jgi:hypothetical protein
LERGADWVSVINLPYLGTLPKISAAQSHGSCQTYPVSLIQGTPTLIRLCSMCFDKTTYGALQFGGLVDKNHVLTL